MNYKLAAKIVASTLWVALPIVLPSKHTEFERLRSTENTTVNYFIAGIANQPSGAFAFLTDHPALQNDDIVLVPYCNNGVSFRQICRDIEQDITSHYYSKVRFFGISMGTKVGHYFALNRAAKEFDPKADGEIDFNEVEIECYEINPCWSPQFLNSRYQKIVRAGAVPATIAECALGPLSLIPCIPASDEHFSARLMMSQVRRIGYNAPRSWLEKSWTNSYLDCHLPENGGQEAINSAVKAVILSSEDEFLDNEVIADYYDSEIVAYVKTSHGNTIDAGNLYREKLDQFLPR